MSTYADFPILLECPNCKRLKPLVHQASGNTYGAVFWSDMKREAPMLTPLSSIQKCPSCGRFFALKEAKDKTFPPRDHNTTWDTGKLTFRQAIAAVAQFASDSKTDPETILNARIILLQAYNDRFRQKKHIGILTWLRAKADLKVFQDNAKAILQMDNAPPYLKAELLRELGRFDECLSMLETIPESDGWFKAVFHVRVAAKAGNPSLLNISFAERRRIVKEHGADIS